MPTTMIMQRMSVAMEYGVILKWLKKEGDKVKKGEPIVEIFGEKNEFELESPTDGVLLKILCEVDDEIPISEPIAIIGKKGDMIPDIKPRKLTEAPAPSAAAVPEIASKQVEATQTADSTPAASPETSQMTSGRIKASPRAKKKARDLGIDISTIVGSGPEGRIVEKDVVAAPSTVQPFFDDERIVKSTEPLTPLRRTIARRMTQSYQRPHITMVTEIDMTEAAVLRSELNQRTEKELGVRISFNDIIIKAVADTLEKFPRFNSTLIGNDLHIFEDIHIGVAMAMQNALIVPVVRNANKKSITEIALETKELGRKARENELKPEELTGSTFTVSNLGPFRVDLFIPVINPPESAILALGQIKKKPVIVDDMIAVRHVMMASCAVDHRVLDGAPAGLFLQALKENLESPFLMKY
ncbi:MAG: 2-oxo acid dehydrogenase subunit E2 [Candidatus Thorarchaeota archaeon]|nr:MAG: 2-oxo acid dehydrogenase subunit E2 [Candidatus Thorarchaeota archaeon]